MKPLPSSKTGMWDLIQNQENWNMDCYQASHILAKVVQHLKMSKNVEDADLLLPYMIDVVSLLCEMGLELVREFVGRNDLTSKEFKVFKYYLAQSNTDSKIAAVKDAITNRKKSYLDIKHRMSKGKTGNELEDLTSLMWIYSLIKLLPNNRTSSKTFLNVFVSSK